MLLRAVQTICIKNVFSCAPCRLLCHSIPRNGSSKTHDSISEQIEVVGDNAKKTTLIEKTIYPDRRLKPRVTHNLHVPEEHPWDRVKRAMNHDYETAKSFIKGKAPPPVLESSDILIVGGGIVGSSIAYHLSERAGAGINIVVLEKDPPVLSSSLSTAYNGLYQQVTSKPSLEMAQYGTEFYRKLGYTFEDPDLPKVDTSFLPGSSLQLASEDGSQILEDLSEIYQDVQWKHQLLSPSMLKKRYPWMNVEGVALGCLGMQKEGLFNQWKVLSAMRSAAKKHNTAFVQGELIGFEFTDQSDFASTETQYNQYFSPCQAVVQKPSGEIFKYHFGYVILAAGASLSDVTDLLNIGNLSLGLPIKAQKQSVYEFQCANGPGIDMPMIMEPNGLRVRKSAIVDKYVVWQENDCKEEIIPEKQAVDNNAYHEKLIPQLVKRVPCFRDAELLSSQTGLIDKCSWDDNILMGPLPAFHNVLLAGGFGNDEFLYAPAVGQGISDLVLDRDYSSIDLSCYRMERIALDLKLDRVVVK